MNIKSYSIQKVLPGIIIHYIRAYCILLTISCQKLKKHIKMALNKNVSAVEEESSQSQTLMNHARDGQSTWKIIRSREGISPCFLGHLFSMCILLLSNFTFVTFLSLYFFSISHAYFIYYRLFGFESFFIYCITNFNLPRFLYLSGKIKIQVVFIYKSQQLKS